MQRSKFVQLLASDQTAAAAAAAKAAACGLGSRRLSIFRAILRGPRATGSAIGASQSRAPRPRVPADSRVAQLVILASESVLLAGETLSSSRLFEEYNLAPT